MENVYYPYMSTGSNLKNIGLNEMTGVKQLLLRRGSNKFVKWIQLLLTSAHELGMNHNNATALYWKTVELIEHAILVRQNGSFSFIPTPFFFPIWLKIQVFDVTASPYRATELIAYTGPKDEEIHVFHRLLSTRYRGKYNLTIKKLGTIIREAKHLSEEDWRKKHNQRPNQRPNSPNSPSNKSGSIKRNTPNNVDCLATLNRWTWARSLTRSKLQPVSPRLLHISNETLVPMSRWVSTSVMPPSGRIWKRSRMRYDITGCMFSLFTKLQQVVKRGYYVKQVLW